MRVRQRARGHEQAPTVARTSSQVIKRTARSELRTVLRTGRFRIGWHDGRYPRQESNLHPALRRRVLYPLSYEGLRRRQRRVSGAYPSECADARSRHARVDRDRYPTTRGRRLALVCSLALRRGRRVRLSSIATDPAPRSPGCVRLAAAARDAPGRRHDQLRPARRHDAELHLPDRPRPPTRRRYTINLFSNLFAADVHRARKGASPQID